MKKIYFCDIINIEKTQVGKVGGTNMKIRKMKLVVFVFFGLLLVGSMHRVNTSAWRYYRVSTTVANLEAEAERLNWKSDDYNNWLNEAKEARNNLVTSDAFARWCWECRTSDGAGFIRFFVILTTILVETGGILLIADVIWTLKRKLNRR